VNLDSLPLFPTPVTRNRDVDWAVSRREHSPEDGRAPVADNGRCADSERSRHAPTFEAEIGMSDGVNAAMKTVQAPGSRAAKSRVFADTYLA
jgi:hypothetical protein